MPCPGWKHSAVEPRCGPELPGWSGRWSPDLIRPDIVDGRGGGMVAMALSTQVTISTEQVDLLSVAGQLDNTGLTQLRQQLELLVDTGTVCLVVDLVRVISCDHRLFDVLARTHQFPAEHQGWTRLVGIGPAVINALDEALPWEFLLVCQGLGRWTG
jgi:hypothetical protein